MPNRYNDKRDNQEHCQPSQDEAEKIELILSLQQIIALVKHDFSIKKPPTSGGSNCGEGGISASFSGENSLPAAALNAPMVASIDAHLSRLRSMFASAGSNPASYSAIQNKPHLFVGIVLHCGEGGIRTLEGG